MSESDPDDVLQPDDLDDEEESPYRRPKPVQVRRQRVSQRIGKILRWSLVGFVVLVPLGYGAFRMARFALTSARFKLISARDVAVEGNQYVSPDEVLNALGLPASGSAQYGVNAFRMPLDEMRKRVESIPWVRSATLTRAYPHRLIVHVIERAPVAFVNAAGKLKLVDGDGVLLEKPDRASFAFPVITGLESAGTAAERRARLALYQTFTGQMSDAARSSGWLISEVDLADADDLKAVLVQGRDTILVHFGHQDFADRFRDFLGLIPEMHKTSDRIESVDLRYRNQVVVNPQPAASLNSKTPNPTGAPRE